MSLRDTLIHAAVLGGFSMAAAGLLAGGNLLTEQDIRRRAAEDLEASLAQVVPAAIHDNRPAEDVATFAGPAGQPIKVFRARRRSEVTGVAYEVVGAGYAGPIRLILGLDRDGNILGVRVVRHNETPGLGDKIEAAKSDWVTRFAGLSLGRPPAERWRVKKDGGSFDQFSGATVTPRAVVAAIRDGLVFFAAHRAELLAPATMETR